VSKRLSAPYRSGPSRDWIKVKNRDSPAMIRAREADWSRVGATRPFTGRPRCDHFASQTSASSAIIFVMGDLWNSRSFAFGSGLLTGEFALVLTLGGGGA
jgi:hypothetical protein